MQWNLFEHTWQQSRTVVKQRWDDLTQEDLSFIAGKRERLIDKIRQRYGVSREKAQSEVHEFERRRNFGAELWI